MTEPPVDPPRPEPARTPSAWGLCPICGVAAPDRALHQQWHEQLDALLTAAPETSIGEV